MIEALVNTSSATYTYALLANRLFLGTRAFFRMIYLGIYALILENIHALLAHDYTLGNRHLIERYWAL